jgi:fluoride exporter
MPSARHTAGAAGDAGAPRARGPFGPVDPDVDLHDPDQQREWARHRVVLPVIAAGGMVGATARHLAEVTWPAVDGGVPWATLAINVTGCLLIGVLMVLVVEAGGAHPLVRPFLGVGVLGGFTTFSTYTGEVVVLLADAHPLRAVGYLVGTVVLALAAVTLGAVLARGAVRRRTTSRRAVRAGDA